MVSLIPLVGFFISLIVSISVYIDITRHHVPQPQRILWAVTIGIGSFTGFLIPHLFGDSLHRIYLLTIKPEPVVTSPLEILAVDLAVGIAISALLVCLYGLRIRSKWWGESTME